MSNATVTQRGALDMQVCVPKNWPDKEVLHFANTANPSGTSNGWTIRKEGDPALSSDSERTPCKKHSGNVHIILDA